MLRPLRKCKALSGIPYNRPITQGLKRRSDRPMTQAGRKATGRYRRRVPEGFAPVTRRPVLDIPISRSSNPVLEAQSGQTRKPRPIVRDEAESGGAGVPGDHHVEGTDRRPARCKLGPDLACPFRGRQVEIENVETRRQSFDAIEVAANGLRLVRSAEEPVAVPLDAHISPSCAPWCRRSSSGRVRIVQIRMFVSSMSRSLRAPHAPAPGGWSRSAMKSSLAAFPLEPFGPALRARRDDPGPTASDNVPAPCHRSSCPPFLPVLVFHPPYTRFVYTYCRAGSRAQRRPGAPGSGGDVPASRLIQVRRRWFDRIDSARPVAAPNPVKGRQDETRRQCTISQDRPYTTLTPSSRAARARAASRVASSAFSRSVRSR